MSFPFLQPYAGLGNSLQTAQASGGAGGVGGWVELGRTTLGSAGDALQSGTVDGKKYLWLIASYENNAAADINALPRFNADSGSNYATRYSINGASDTTRTSRTWCDIESGGQTERFANMFIANNASKEKLCICHQMDGGTAGSGNSPNRWNSVSKWTNTSNQITSIEWDQRDGGDYASGAELVVLGYDPADTHTTNFWQELASVTLGTDGDNLSSGTISAKKYLWVQAFIKNAGDTARFNTQVTFNNDTSGNYAMRRSFDGGADSTSTGASNLFSSGVTGSNDDLWCMNLFIVNNSANEKLCIAHGFDTYIGSGAGFAPSQRYEAVGKWANTSSQITEIDITNSDTSNYDAISELRVWGAD